jgi:hypothetical protein
MLRQIGRISPKFHSGILAVKKYTPDYLPTEPFEQYATDTAGAVTSRTVRARDCLVASVCGRAPWRQCGNFVATTQAGCVGRFAL